MKQYFKIQEDRRDNTLHFFEDWKDNGSGGRLLALHSVDNMTQLGEDWEYVRMAGDFPVLKRKIA